MSIIKQLFICLVASTITSSGSPAIASDQSTSSNSDAYEHLLAVNPIRATAKTSSLSGSGSSGGLSKGVNASSSSSSTGTGAGSSGSSSSGGSSSGGKSTSSGPVISGTTIPSTVTHLIISNKTGSPVTIGVQCQLPGALVQDGCTTNISDMAIIDVTSGATPTPQAFTTFSTGQGTYALASMHQYEIVNLKANPFSVPANQQQNCLQGLIVSFGQWNNCPVIPPNVTPAFPIPFVAGPAIPNGSNGAEPTLNIPSTINGVAVTGTGSTEVCDITCVNGANSILKLTITSPSQAPAGGSQALAWLYDASGSIGAGQSFSTTNSWVNIADKCDDNCYKLVNGVQTDRPGVFPYGCTQCNINPDPKPPCGQFCAAQNGLASNTGCTFNRAAQTANPVTARFGGTVEFSYLSPAVPTPACQGMGQP
ncbi:hypothetical protein KBI23_27055 [bacterium]|nr:hypothetical protein [bacterium]MBP9807879.1 hypothetical protein [bacterium]